MNQKNAPWARIELATLPTLAGCSTDWATKGACLTQLQVYIYTDSLDLQIIFRYSVARQPRQEESLRSQLRSGFIRHAYYVRIFEVIRLVEILVLLFWRYCMSKTL